MGISLSALGCMNPNIRWPQLYNPDLLSERRSIERYDPFPDEDAAPETFTRPPSYTQQRTDIRRSSEQRAFEGTLPSASAGPRVPSTIYRNSQVVQP
ncbi:hypothetical protein Pla110_35820 [Polystyrenella longa]|uniref:Uncharacterized protein n=2 Tax=Polystyrenella longa TaxID=2528007 RepID=A0A518CRH4_9PLAN|nr:hypothetical protein Pla110_35820 [Polystyrenella longa]